MASKTLLVFASLLFASILLSSEVAARDLAEQLSQMKNEIADYGDCLFGCCKPGPGVCFCCTTALEKPDAEYTTEVHH